LQENWEDEEEEKRDEEKEEADVKQPPPTNKKKTLAEKIAEKEQKEREAIAIKKAAKEAFKSLSPEDKAAEKLRLQRLQEEADLKV